MALLTQFCSLILLDYTICSWGSYASLIIQYGCPTDIKNGGYSHFAIADIMTSLKLVSFILHNHKVLLQNDGMKPPKRED